MYFFIFFFPLFCLLLYYFYKKINYFQKSGIPYKQPLPILGNLGPIFLKKMSYTQLLKNSYNLNQKAKYIGFFEFTTPLIIIRDPEIVKLICAKNFDVFYNRRGLAEENQDIIVGKDISSLKNEKWHKMRNLLNPLFASNKMKMSHELIKKNVQSLLEQIHKKQGTAINLRVLFQKFIVDIIFVYFYGIQTNCIKEDGDSFYVVETEDLNVDRLFRQKFLLLNFPLIWKLLRLSFLGERANKFFINIVQSVIENRNRENFKNSSNMIHLMMDTSDKMGKLSLEEMAAQVFFIFIASNHTTSETLMFLCYELAMKMEIQEKLQNEIDSLRNNYCNETLSKEENLFPNKITLENIMNLKFLDSIIKETLRLHTALPFFDRICSQTFQLPPALPGLKPFILKPGSLIIIPSEAIHLDSKYYQEPKNFNPDRFFNVNEKIITNSYTYLPFGAGPRHCIANRFSLQIIKIVIFYIFTKYNVKLDCKTPLEVKMLKNSVINIPEQEIMLRFEERLI